MSDGISKELFREGGWAVVYKAHKYVHVGVRVTVRHDKCGTSVWAVVTGDEGTHCYTCNEPVPTFIQHMWTFASWCHK